MGLGPDSIDSRVHTCDYVVFIRCALCLHCVYEYIYFVFTLCLFILHCVYGVFIKLSLINVMYLSYVSYASPIFSVWGV